VRITLSLVPSPLAANRKVIETFLAYAHEQGLTPEPRHIDELFVDAGPQLRQAGE
jgi:hypothetical protein